MQNKVCCCFGHRDCSELDTDILYSIVEKLIVEEGVKVFFNGNRGDFDFRFAITISSLKRKYPDISHVLVEPYPSKYLEINNGFYEFMYDSIIIPKESANAHYRAAIPIRNRWIVDNSDIVVAYIQHNYGGAYKAVQYAEEKNKQIIYLTSDNSPNTGNGKA